MELVSKLLIAVCVAGILRTSRRFQSMSRELDDSAYSLLRRFMRTAEDSGFPPEIVPLLMLLSTMVFMLAMGITPGAGR
jgi:hypothetical protein